MHCNVGKTDRQIRIIAGGLIVAAGIMFNSWWGAIGLLPLITGVMRWCPAYIPLGIKTGCDDKPKTACCGGGCHSKEPPQS
ncbi:MAG: DUF2892 domain-containing protein [Alphaproteobacteria bacterium]